MRFVKKRLKPRLLFVYALAVALIVYARPTATSLLVGLVLIVVGEFIRIWGAGHLHKNDALTVTGPYAYVRNPLYLGTLLIVGGFAVIAAAPLAWAVAGALLLGYFAYYMPYKNRIETARLESLYGDAFRRYAVAVPSLVPRLHAYVPLGHDAPELPDWWDRFKDNNEIGTAVVVAIGVLALTARWLLL